MWLALYIMLETKDNVEYPLQVLILLWCGVLAQEPCSKAASHKNIFFSTASLPQSVLFYAYFYMVLTSLLVLVNCVTFCTVIEQESAFPCQQQWNYFRQGAVRCVPTLMLVKCSISLLWMFNWTSCMPASLLYIPLYTQFDTPQLSSLTVLAQKQ